MVGAPLGSEAARRFMRRVLLAGSAGREQTDAHLSLWSGFQRSNGWRTRIEIWRRRNRKKVKNKIDFWRPIQISSPSKDGFNSLLTTTDNSK